MSDQLEESPADRASENPPQSKSALALSILRKCPRFADTKGRAYIELDGVAVPLRRSDQLHRWTAARFAEEHGDTLSVGHIEQAVLALAGMPLERRDVGVRTVSTPGGGFAVDAANDGGDVALIDAGGVVVTKNREHAFFRPTGTGALPVSAETCIPDEDDLPTIFDCFFSLLNINESHTRTSILAFLMAAVRPLGPYPILLIRGPQGSGKTTLARELRALVDPRSPEDLELPRSAHDLAILAEQYHLLSFDNVSVVDTKRSDALCRIATGAGFMTRTLRTDREMATFSAARPITLTSIGDISASPDLLDRALLIELKAPLVRANVTTLRSRLDEMRADVICALWRACSVALREPPGEVSSSIRMIEAARAAAAAEAALGLPPGAVEEAFISSRSAAVSINALDPVVTGTLEILDTVPTWSGSLEELLERLRGYQGKSRTRVRGDLPRTARQLRDRLDRLADALAALGIVVDLSQLDPRKRTRVVTLSTRVMPPEGGS